MTGSAAKHPNPSLEDGGGKRPAAGLDSAESFDDDTIATEESVVYDPMTHVLSKRHFDGHQPIVTMSPFHKGNGTLCVTVKLTFSSGVDPDLNGEMSLSAVESVLSVECKAPYWAVRSSRALWEALYTNETTGKVELPDDINRMLIAEEDALKRMFPHQDSDHFFHFEFLLPFPVKATRNPEFLQIFKIDDKKDEQYGSVVVMFALESAQVSLFESKKKAPCKRVKLKKE